MKDSVGKSSGPCPVDSLQVRNCQSGDVLPYNINLLFMENIMGDNNTTIKGWHNVEVLERRERVW